MKKRILLLFLCLLLAAAPLGGCAPKEDTGGLDITKEFISLISDGEYAAAWELLDAGTKYDQSEIAEDRRENTTQPGKTITLEQFVQRYTNIFDALGITSMTVEDISYQKSELIAMVTYTMTYHSQVGGELTYTFHTDAIKEDGQWRVEWTPAMILPDLDWGYTVRVSTLPARRGEILAGTQVLAQNVNAVTVYAVPSKITDRELFLSRVSALLDTSREALAQKLDRAYNDFALLKQFYPDELDDLTREELLLNAGLGIDESNYGTLRNYPMKDSLAHIVGYVGRISTEELMEYTGSTAGNERYNGDSVVGKTGLEKKYETELRGVDGKLYFIADGTGARVSTICSIPARHGYDVQLTMDADLQQRLDEVVELTLWGTDTAGAVIVMDPHTGAVEAMGSYPAYDLNEFARGISEKSWQEILNQENTPLYNRLIQGQYPPGSIFKPFTAAMVLEEGILTAGDEFPDGKGEDIEDNKWRPSDEGEFGPWAYAAITRVSLNNRHRPLNMHNAIVDSDNIYFAWAALKTGESLFETYFESLGMNQSVPFDLSVSKSQLLNSSSQWNPQLLADSGYGQGEVLTTPMQICAMYTAFANHTGDMMVPYCVKGLYENTEDGRYRCVQAAEPQVWIEDTMSPDVITAIEPMMEDVQNIGTGYHLGLKRKVSVACKTGTAEIGSDKSREIAWFVGYRTGVEPEQERLVLVMLELPTAKEYAELKFDIARELLELE